MNQSAGSPFLDCLDQHVAHKVVVFADDIALDGKTLRPTPQVLDLEVVASKELVDFVSARELGFGVFDVEADPAKRRMPEAREDHPVAPIA